MTAMRRRKIHFKWWMVRLLCLSSGLDYQNVVGWGDTYHLPSNWNIKYKYFLHKKEEKQGQGNLCQTPGFKFEELTGWKKGKNGKKLEETGRNRETEEKTRPKVKTMAYLFLLCWFFNPFYLSFLVKTCVFMKTRFFRKTFFGKTCF